MTELSRFWKKTEDNMSKYYHQHYQPQPDYKEGDEVLLNAQNIQTVRLIQKVSPKFYGLFRILAKIGKSAYRIKCQTHW
jgi:hypothetical protein